MQNMPAYLSVDGDQVHRTGDGVAVEGSMSVVLARLVAYVDSL